MSQDVPGAADAAASAKSLRDDYNALPSDQQAEVKGMLGSIGGKWWLLLVLGILSIIAGLLIVFNPNAAILTIAIFFGIYLLITGIVEVVRGFADDLDTGAKVLSIIVGVISIVLGILCLRNLATSVTILVLFIGITFVMRGVLEVIVGFSGRGNDGAGWYIFLGILSIIAGIVVLVWPGLSLATLVIVLGIWLIFLGIIEIVMAFRVKSVHDQIGDAVATL